MAEIHKLICTLKESIVTDDGDFIPEGTPVQVLQWAGMVGRAFDAGGQTNFLGSIKVRTHAYMWADREELNDKSNGSTGKGLVIEVHPSQLKYKDSFTLHKEE